MIDDRQRRLTLVACILGSSIVFVDSTVVNVALPALRASLQASLADQQWVVEAYLLMLGSLVLVGGALGDVLGRRRVFVVGTAGFGAMSLLCAVAPSSELLIAARTLQGIAGALLVPSSLAIITEVYDADTRAAAIGTWTAWTSALIALGPPLGGVLVDVASWRWVFAVNVPLVIAALWLTARVMPELPPRGSHEIDFVGGVLCAVGLGGPVFALIEQARYGFGSPVILVPLFGGFAVLVAFVAYEHHVAGNPMLPPGIFRARNFAVGNVATLLIYAGLGAATFFIAVFLQQVSGYRATTAGLALLPVALCSILLARSFGVLSARIGPRLLMGVGPLIAAIGLALYIRLGAHSSYLTVVLPASLIFGIGLSMTVTPLTATVLSGAPPEHAGLASGVNNAIARVASLLSIAAVGAIVASSYASHLDARLTDVQRASHAAMVARTRPLAVTARDPQLADAERGASITAFRAGALTAAIVVALGGVVSLIGIVNPPRRLPS